MKPRKDPTNEQLVRRRQREPIGDRDPRAKNDAYWALRHQGFPHAYAKRAIRDMAPRYYKARIQADPSEDDEYLADVDLEEILVAPYPDRTELVKLSVLMRPDLTEDVVITASPRDVEYTIWSERPPGFGLRVRPSGARSYIVMFRIKNGAKQGKITLGKAGLLSLEVARWLAREVRCIASCGFDPRPLHKTGELLNQYRREARLGSVPPRYPGFEETVKDEDDYG